MKVLKLEFDVITYTECGCILASGIDDDNCLKRYYLITDIINSKHYYLKICNEYLRLMIHKHRALNNSMLFKHYMEVRRAIEEVIFEKIERPSIDESAYFWNDSKDFLKQNISYELCMRPDITGHISVIQACEIVANNPYNYRLHDLLIDKFNTYIENCVHKKYKSFYEKARIMAHKLRKTYGDERAVAANEFAIYLLTLKTKTT